MEVFINELGLVDYKVISSKATAQDFADAVSRFLDETPLSCSECPPDKHCCKQPWKVHVDNVFVRRNAKNELGKFFEKKLDKDPAKGRLALKKNRYCRYLTGKGRCAIYKKRPLVCQLYMCLPASPRYDLLRGFVGCAFQVALVSDLNKALFDKELGLHNPAEMADDYNIPIAELLRFMLNFSGDEMEQDLINAMIVEFNHQIYIKNYFDENE